MKEQWRTASGDGVNRLLGALSKRDLALLSERLAAVALSKGDVLFEPGDDVAAVHFPTNGMVAALVLSMQDGASAEAAMIGAEGAVGGVISAGDKPAFTRAVVQIGGTALRLPIEILEEAKEKSEALRDHFARYSDCLLAQVLQLAACNAIHTAEARLARWLLSIHDKVGRDQLPATQDFVAEMLGVQRTYVTKIIAAHVEAGAITHERGCIIVSSRARLEAQACECYADLRRHFDNLLPGVYR